MKTETYNDQILTAYLLGLLPEKETERLDELSITDDELVVRLSVVENDLVDAYVHGELSGQTLDRFNLYYLSSPRRQHKVRFAETFQGVHGRVATAGIEDAVKPSQTSTRRRFFAVPRLAMGWGLAAAAFLMLLTVGYLLLENVRLRNSITHAQAERAALQQREQELQGLLDQQKSDDAETVRELERVRESLAQVEQQLGNIGDKSQISGIVSFVLSPQTRGAGHIPAIDLQRTTESVALQLVLESDDFPAYQVALQNPATNQIIWRSGKLKARSRGQSKTVSVRLPASLLKPQNYSLELNGIPTTGAAEIISSYPLKVVLK